MESNEIEQGLRIEFIRGKYCKILLLFVSMQVLYLKSMLIMLLYIFGRYSLVY